MIVAGIVCLLSAQSVLTFFWMRVAQSYGDQPIPMVRSVPSYPPRSMRVLVVGTVVLLFGLSQVNFALSPWQAGLIAGAVMAFAAVPVCVHNLDLRRRRIGVTPPASD